MFVIIGGLVLAGVFTLAGMLYNHDDKRIAILTFFLGGVFTLAMGCKIWSDSVTVKTDVANVDRPSLFVRRLSLDNLGSGRIPVGTIFIENLGKSDAIDVEQESALIIEKQKLTSDPPTLSRDDPPVKTIIPAERGITLSAKAILLLKAETVESIKQQTSFIYFYGVVHYYGRQLPKEEQILKFCGLYDPVTGEFKQTRFHNDTR
jgi:uncharacterized Rmd1/YagE family protein